MEKAEFLDTLVKTLTESGKFDEIDHDGAKVVYVQDQDGDNYELEVTRF